MSILLPVLVVCGLAAAVTVMIANRNIAGAARVKQHAAAAASSAFIAGIAILAIAAVLIQAGRSISVAILVPLLIVAAVPGISVAIRNSRLGLRSRRSFEAIGLAVLGACAAIAIATTVGIVFSMLAESVRFFTLVPVSDFLFGIEWSPQTAIREDQVGSSGKFGLIPLLAGTVLIAAIALAIAAAVGVVVAIYLSEFASPRWRRLVKPVLEYLAGIPTVVYGFFAVVVLNPFLRELGADLGVEIASETAFACGLMIAALILPFVISLSEDAMYAVPDDLRAGALALGATRFEMALHVVVPAAMPGIVSSILLAFSRAVGETMIVVMAAGLSATLTANPLESVTTITVQIVALLTGDQEFDDPKTLAAFGLGLVLFVITLLLNALALTLVRRYQERYE